MKYQEEVQDIKKKKISKKNKATKEIAVSKIDDNIFDKLANMIKGPEIPLNTKKLQKEEYINQKKQSQNQNKNSNSIQFVREKEINENEIKPQIQIIEKDLHNLQPKQIELNQRKQKRKEYMKNLKKEVLSQPYDATSRCIFIGNLDRSTTTDDLKQFFQNEKIESCRLLKDSQVIINLQKGRSKGIAFIDFFKPEDARMAVDQNGVLFMGKNIKVDISVSKKKLETQELQNI